MDLSKSQVSFSHAEERRRTFWSIYILDRLVSCGRARPPAILEASCQLQLPCNEDVWRSGQWQKTQTLEGFSNRRLSDARDYSPFALVVLTTYALSRSAQYQLQQYNIRSKDPPWDPKSDFASIMSDLLYLESHFDFDRPATEIVKQILGPGGPIKQSHAGPTIFAHAMFYLSNCLLNHPFLVRRRLELSEVKGSTTSFLSRTFASSREYATRLINLLDETSGAGLVVLTSFYGYCAVIAGSIHGLYCHAADADIALESFQLLQKCTTFLDGLSCYWRNCSNMVGILPTVRALAQANFETSEKYLTEFCGKQCSVPVARPASPAHTSTRSHGCRNDVVTHGLQHHVQHAGLISRGSSLRRQPELCFGRE